MRYFEKKSVFSNKVIRNAVIGSARKVSNLIDESTYVTNHMPRIQRAVKQLNTFKREANTRGIDISNFAFKDKIIEPKYGRMNNNPTGKGGHKKGEPYKIDILLKAMKDREIKTNEIL